MQVIECNNLTKRYGESRALNGLSFKITENKITGLIGRNGAGKTTLLRIISGFLEKTSGEIQVFSESPFNNLYVSANMIFINDNMTFPETLKLSELLKTAGDFYEKWDDVLAQRLFDYFSLNPNEYYYNLSKGMRSTFNVIIGLSTKCALTLFDEPTIGMDAAVRKDFYRALLKDYLYHPRTIMISSHHMNEIEHLLEEVILIRKGTLLLHMPLSDLKEFALGLQGKSALIRERIQGREVLFEKNIGSDELYVVVKNDFTDANLHKAAILGIIYSPVSAEDLCVYLTSETKGGIDDVFNRS